MEKQIKRHEDATETFYRPTAPVSTRSKWYKGGENGALLPMKRDLRGRLSGPNSPRGPCLDSNLKKIVVKAFFLDNHGNFNCLY